VILIKGTRTLKAMIYSSLFRLGLLCIPGYAFAVELETTEDAVPDSFIITLKPTATEGRRLTNREAWFNLVTGIIQGDDNGIGAQSHGEPSQIYDSLNGFAANLDKKGLEMSSTMTWSRVWWKMDTYN